MYITQTCPWCQKAKIWLRKKKLRYEERDISESQNGKFRDEILEKTGQMSVPVIEINGQIIMGFDEKKLEELTKKPRK